MGRLLVLLVVLTAACSNQAGKPVPAPTSSSPVPASASSSPVAATPSNLSVGGVVEYRVPDVALKPADCYGSCAASIGSLTLGPDGNVWYVDIARELVGRISPAGEIKQFRLAVAPAGGPHTITAGPDGNLWLTAVSGSILRVTPVGQVTTFDVGGGPVSITAGPDGNLWFTGATLGQVYRMTPSGSVVEFNGPPSGTPAAITTGPDRNLWFTGSTTVGKMTTDGRLTNYQVGNDASLPLRDIAVGADGNLWFTGGGGIWHMSPSGGAITRVPLPSDSQPAGLVAGPDGNVWFTDGGRNAITRVSVAGVIREFPMARRSSDPLGIAVGTDGRIWFGESGYATVASIGVKVPEVSLGPRSVIFGDASPQTITVRNSGDATLAISGVRVSGLDGKFFVKGTDGCAGAALAPGATCTVDLRHVGGGPAGLQSAVFEVADNGTGSPQRISLVAQAPQCRLPVTDGVLPANLPQGEQLDVRSAQILPDPSGGFEPGAGGTGVHATAPPGLTGNGAGYYDRAAGRWLPVYDARSVSPDGSRYAYLPNEPAPRTDVHVVDVRTGHEIVRKIKPDFWAVVAFNQQGIYLHTAYEGIGGGLWLLNPDSGAFKAVLTGDPVTVVDGTTAWLREHNPADKLPEPSGIGGSSDEILRRDLVTGKTTVWLYSPGKSLFAVAAANGMPIVFSYDGVSISYSILTSPNQAKKMDFPFTADLSPSFSGFTSDSAGLWVGSLDGVYLWTPRTGGVLMSEAAVTPAGTCA